MSRASVRSFPIVLAALGILGCGSDEVVPGTPDAGDEGADATPMCVDPGDRPFPEGLLADPGAFPRDACDAGSLAGLDPTGLWYIERDVQPLFGSGPVRFALTCEDGLSVTLSSTASASEIEFSVLTGDDLFFRRQRDFDGGFSFVDTYDVCRRDPDGTLVGYTASCFSGDFGEQCNEPQEIRIEPFGRIDGEAEADGVELVAELSSGPDGPWPEGFTSHVAVRGDIAYLTREADGLRVIDVSDPASPTEVGYFPGEEDFYNDIHLVERDDGTLFALIASAARGVIVIDVSDPASPTEVTTFSLGGPDEPVGVHRFQVDQVGDQTRAYLADGGSRFLPIFDVTDPAAPILLGTYETPTDDDGIHALSSDGGILYVSATIGGLFIVDATDPANPVELGRYQKERGYSHYSWPATAGGRQVLVHGDEGYDSHVEILDVDPESPTFAERIGELQLRPEVSIHNMTVVGERAFVAHYQDGLRIVDLSDPTAPALDAYFNTWDPETAAGALLEGAVDVDVAPDGLIYLADMPRGLMIFRETE